LEFKNMASGKLAAVLLASYTNTEIYTPPANTVSTVNISLCNKGSVDTVISVGLTESSTTWGGDDTIVSRHLLRPGDVLEKTGVVLTSGQYILASASAGNAVAVVVWGFEQPV
jgi:hypothetical protein